MPQGYADERILEIEDFSPFVSSQRQHVLAKRYFYFAWTGAADEACRSWLLEPCTNGSENHRLLGPVWFCYSAAPPSTVSVEPVIMAASSETTKRNAFAMCSGVWSRPSGVAARRRS